MGLSNLKGLLKSALKGIYRDLGFWGLLGASWNLVSRVIHTLIGVRSDLTAVTLLITPIAKAHDPLSTRCRFQQGFL